MRAPPWNPFLHHAMPALGPMLGSARYYTEDDLKVLRVIIWTNREVDGP